MTGLPNKGQNALAPTHIINTATGSAPLKLLSTHFSSQQSTPCNTLLGRAG